MKESANRYYIMMFFETIKESFTNEEDFKKFLESYAKRNRDAKSQFVGGNFKIKFSEENLKVIEYSLYKKITIPTNLETIDRIVTNNYESEASIKERYAKEVEERKGKLYIGYMYNGQAKTLPLFYKKDKKYTDYNALTKLMIDNILEPTFLAHIWTNPKFNSSEYRKKISYHLEKIQVAYGKYVMQRIDDTKEIQDTVRDFMKAWCTTKGSINQRSVREVGSIIKNILTKLEQVKNQKEELPSINDKQTKKKVRVLKDSENDIRLF